MLNDYVDEIYVINLDRSTERFKEFNNNNGKLLGDFTRVSACEFSVVPGVAQKFIGHYGCAMSHVKIAKKALSKGQKQIAVFEDDALLHTRYREQSESIFKIMDLRPEWDIFYLWNRSKNWEPIEEGKIKLIEGTGRTHAMILGEEALHFIVNNEHMYKTKAIDYVLRDSETLIKFASWYNLVITSPGYSEIEKRFAYCPLD